MITKILEWKLLQESKLVPRNIDGRAEKLRQHNLKMLQQEVIEVNLLIDDLFNFSGDEIKTKTINGNVILYVTTRKVPKWLENVKINGNFQCFNNKLTSLEGCPKHINGNFDCSSNNLTSLDGCPEYVGGQFNCSDNLLTSLKYSPKIINKSFYCSRNKLISLEGMPKYVGGQFNCSDNFKYFKLNDIPKRTVIKGTFFTTHAR